MPIRAIRQAMDSQDRYTCFALVLSSILGLIGGWYCARWAAPYFDALEWLVFAVVFVVVSGLITQAITFIVWIIFFSQ